MSQSDISRSELSRSELIRELVDLGALVTGPQPLDDRLNGLCEIATRMLDCNHCTVMQRDGSAYRGRWQFGLSDHNEQLFRKAQFPLEPSNQQRIEGCGTYLLINDAREDPVVAEVAQRVAVNSVVIVPFTYPDGEPLGYLAVSYTEDKREITHDEAELSLGLARILQTILLRSLETQRRQELSVAVLNVADSERRRLSRDIHDDPLQRILSVRIGLEGFREKLVDPELSETVDHLIDECRGASSSLREVMLRTHPNSSELADLEEALTQMVNRKEYGSDVTLRFSDERASQSPSYLIPALNRIGEQAARNALRHANATELVVQLTDVDGGTLLRIADNGTGFEQANTDPKRLGLVSMRERTELLGGAFTITSPAGIGTTISAWFPHAEV